MRFDCVVVGAGPAGISAAVRIARGGLSVLVLEAGVYPGAENWSGAVYFSENLERPEVFGAEVIAKAPFERRVVRRGAYLYNGHSLIGAAYHDPDTFRSSYTVLRPVYDRFLAEKAREHGVLLAPSTTAQSLIRADGRVSGVMTDRGPVYADVVFLAEGDASHLTSQEGYDPREPDGPDFLQGVKEVIRLPVEVLEQRFELMPHEGACFEFLIRNATRHGRTVRLNMGGFLYTNQDSVSLGFVLPLNNLRDHFDGSHGLLLEWVKSLPQVARWIEGGEPVSFGTKIIRAGRSDTLPQMVDDGLAIGGAATGIGVDFPFPNYTGPATEMGSLFAKGLLALKAAGRPPTAENLAEVYLAPLEQTHYFKNVGYLDSWPDYIERSTSLFESQIDLACSLGYVLTRPDWSLSRKLFESVRTLRIAAPPSELLAQLQDAARLAKAVRLERIVWGGLSPLCWPGWLLGMFVCWLPAKRPAGLRISFVAQAGAEPSGPPPWPVRWYWGRFRGAFAACLRHVYTNDRTPLETKLARCAREVSLRVNLLDLLLLPLAGLLLATVALAQLALELIRRHILRQPFERLRKGRSWDIARSAARVRRLDDDCVNVSETYEAKLGRIQYQEGESSHIKLFWPEQIDRRGELAESPLWSVCPAKVYERVRVPLGVPRVLVNFENCIKCESCWRATDDVHWSRATTHRLIYETYPPSQERLFRYLSEREDPRPHRPAQASFGAHWIAHQQSALEAWMESLDLRFDASDGGSQWEQVSAVCGRMTELVSGLERAIEQYSQALAREPNVLETGRIVWLDELLAARESLMAEFVELVEQLKELGLRGRLPVPGFFELVRDMTQLARRASQHAGARRLFWADLVGRQLLAHHLACIRLFLEAVGGRIPLGPSALPVEQGYFEQAVDVQREAQREALRAQFDNQQLRALENQQPLDASQMAFLVELLTEVQRNDYDGQAELALLEDTAAVDPSLAYILAHQMHAQRLLGACSVFEGSGGSNWLATALAGEDNLVPTAMAAEVLVCGPDGLYIAPVALPELGLSRKTATGLRGAGLALTHPPNPVLAETVSQVALPEGTDHRWLWLETGVPLLAAICRGACRMLLERAREHALGRVQFGSSFQDESGNSGVAKFGAVKRMIAEMALNGYLMDTLRESGDYPERLQLILQKLIATQSFGPHEGSAGYNAGQVFGGTAYSEDDVLAKFYRDSGMFRYLVAHDDALRTELARQYVAALVGEADWLRLDPEAHELVMLERRGMLSAALQQIRQAADQLQAALRQHDWLRKRLAGNAPTDPALILFGGAIAEQLAARAILLRTHRLLEGGVPARMELQAVRLAADRLAPRIQAALDACAEVAQLVALGQAVRNQPFWDVVPTVACEPYQAVIEADPPFRSGAFLTTPFDARQPRHLPERIAGDPDLRATNEQLRDYFQQQYYQRSFDGMPYGRYLETLHRLPADDVESLHERGYLRMFIPAAQGGAGLPKAYYYMLLLQSMRYADPAYALIIMANSSIGTTPILIGRDQDLPRVERELSAVVADTSFLREIESRIDRVIRRLQKRRDPRRVQVRFDALAALVQQKIQRTAVLKYLGGDFLRAFRRAGNRLRRGDFELTERDLLQARELIGELEPAVQRRLAELPRRRRAHDLFLQLIAHGQMSAFSLTEPTAGSDSGGVKTQARLCQRRIFRGEGGVLTFYLDSESRGRPRVLIDADRLVFKDRRIWYRHDPAADPAELRFDEYDYETDAVKTRYYLHAGQRYQFDDIGQLRTDDEGHECWSYYELTGAKMWITNARFCGVNALYAVTPEGVTGFMVDRHAEGFIVGADEEKLGQKGSPTNELSLSEVRVAAENIIGYAGRGQINALETLNVGRGGLCVSTVGVGSDLLTRALQRADPSSETDDYRLGQIAVELLGQETMAHELIGFFDCKLGDTVRVESAIGKYHATEAFHRAIGHAEDLYGLEGTTCDHDLEKKRRDARILNIYEGTNEVQRFLLLKDLSSYLLDRYRRNSRSLSASAPSSRFPEQEQALERAKDKLFGRLSALRERRGDALWANPSHQPSFFPLAEVAGEIKLADAMLYRIDWIARHDAADSSHGSLVTDTGQLVIRRALNKIDRLFERFEQACGHLERELYPPEVQLGFLALEDAEPQHEPLLAALPLRLHHPVEVLVPILPAPLIAPEPRLHEGELCEPNFTLSVADRAALRAASRLKAQAPNHVRVTVVGVSSPHGRDALRQATALGADRCLHVPIGTEAQTTTEVGNAVLAAVQQCAIAPDLVLCGDAPGISTGQAGLAAFLAAALEAQTLLEAGRLTFDSDRGRLQVYGGKAGWDAADRLQIPLPAVISFPQEEDVALDYSLDRWVGACCTPLELMRRHGAVGAMSVVVNPVRFEADDDSHRVTTAEDAAALFWQLSGAAGGPSPEAPPLLVPSRAFDQQDAESAPAVLAFLPPACAQTSELSLEARVAAAGAAEVAEARQLALDVVMPVDCDDQQMRQLVGALARHVPRRIYLIQQEQLGLFSQAGLLQLYSRFLNEYSGSPRAIIGARSLNPLLAALGRRYRAPFWFGVDRISNGGGPLTLITRTCEGRTETLARLRDPEQMFLASVNLGLSLGEALVMPCDPELFVDRLPIDYDPSRDPMAVTAARYQHVELDLGLQTAEYVVDVGYAIKTRERLAQVIHPLFGLLAVEMGLTQTVIGATRKVTQDLKILPMDRQIGQTGVRVAPKILIAAGVSGAPQHMDYIAPETVILCFNKDPDAPLMQWNRDQPKPVVHPILGDLFETLPLFTERLRELCSAQAANQGGGPP